MDKHTIGTIVWLVGFIAMVILLIINFTKIVTIDRTVYYIMFGGSCVISIIGAFVRNNARKSM